MTRQARFADFIKARKAESTLVVQPRMGFGRIDAMRRGLLAVKNGGVPAVGTLTLDSYTRVNDYAAAARALRDGADLNGFPIVTHGSEATRRMLAGVSGPDFPAQVRHGTALPVDIMRAMIASGIDATEGGPVSYCLPYSRVPLRRSLAAWRECCELLAAGAEDGVINHLESFGGCMLGQLCPPSLLIALTTLEGMFFKAHGLRSVSLSYAQGTNSIQDKAALRALRRVAERFLSGVDWHVVLYTYMGVFPQSAKGAGDLLEESARVAVQGGCERLIVKTVVEAKRIPTIAENVAALKRAHAAASRAMDSLIAQDLDEEARIHREATALIEAVLNLGDILDAALLRAFQKGYLDVPYSLHEDNRNLTRAVIDEKGYLVWANPGKMPLPRRAAWSRARQVRSDDLLRMLTYTQRRFDQPELI